MSIGKHIPRPIKNAVLWVARRPEKIGNAIYRAAARGNLPFPDKAFIKWNFKIRNGFSLNLKNPVTFQDKLSWMKLYYHDPAHTTMVDKYAVRKLIANTIGEEYLVPMLGVYDSFDEIDFDALPDQFVMKANHGSGWNIVVKDKEKFDVKSAKSKFDSWMKKNFAFCAGMEMHYKNIKPKIIIEEYCPCKYEYQFWCFNGTPVFVSVVHEPHSENSKRTYDMEGHELDFITSFPKTENKITLPSSFTAMKKLATVCAENFLFVRVDLFFNEERIFMNELTFTPASGLVKWSPIFQDEICGSFLNLEKK